MRRPIRILGIDPGLRRTGWGVIEVEGNRLMYTGCGSVATSDKASLAERLVTLHDALVRVVDEFRPDEAAVEATFVNKDASATLKLGQARGIALMVPAKAGVLIAEYAPNLIKKTIVGAGHGDKTPAQVALNWLICKGAVPIPGAKNAAQAEQNAGALGWRLTADEIAGLDRVAKFGQRGLFNRVWQHG